MKDQTEKNLKIKRMKQKGKKANCEGSNWKKKNPIQKTKNKKRLRRAGLDL